MWKSKLEHSLLVQFVSRDVFSIRKIYTKFFTQLLKIVCYVEGVQKYGVLKHLWTMLSEMDLEAWEWCQSMFWINTCTRSFWCKSFPAIIHGTISCYSLLQTENSVKKNFETKKIWKSVITVIASRSSRTVWGWSVSKILNINTLCIFGGFSFWEQFLHYFYFSQLSFVLWAGQMKSV